MKATARPSDNLGANVIPESVCPVCHHTLDRASCIHDEKAVPESGDFTICIGCTALLIFMEDMTLRLTRPTDLEDMPGDFARDILLQQIAIITVNQNTRQVQ